MRNNNNNNTKYQIFSLKKFIITTFLILFFLGCSNIAKNIPWESNYSLNQNWDKVQVGDIIVKNITYHPLEWFGHVGIVVTPLTIADYPQPFVGYQETYYQYWLKDKRDVVVLRYIGFNEKFNEKFLENIKKFKHQTYWIGSRKKTFNTTYCSKYIWSIYSKTAEDLNYKLDLDRDRGYFVFPYDFLGVKDFKYVE
ncbi:MAG: hypothetical protein ACRC6K_04630 [Fusobacteriaceae bacterium]